jgi:hypothetical protein
VGASRILDAFREGRKEEESSDLRSVAVVLREFHRNPNFLSLSVHSFSPRIIIRIRNFYFLSSYTASGSFMDS